MTRATVPAVALLPIRLFFGATFLYAGLDKLVLDPTFFDASAPTSLLAQLQSFSRLSPLAPLIQACLPLWVPIGLGIAVAEVGIGVGALTGLAFRVAAAGGAALSFLLYLTASWGIKPFYLGPDLPYGIGWLALAIAGHGDIWIPSAVRQLFPGSAAVALDGARRASARSRRAARRRARGLPPEVAPAQLTSRGAVSSSTVPSPERRLLLETGLLAAVAAIAASFALPLRALGLIAEAGPSPLPSGGIPGSGGPSTGAPASGAVATGAGDGGLVVAKVADVAAGGGSTSFTVPFDAPAPLPAGDPGVIVQLADGRFVAFDAICTHAGCTVGWDQPDRLLVCPCHEAAFDPAQGAAVVGGPAPSPLASIPIRVDSATGAISLRA